jgi:hypothetical protein
MTKFEELKARGFVVREKSIANTMCYLVFPSKLDVAWDREHLVYRSSIWTGDMQPVSLGFKKFFNYGEAKHIVEDFTDSQLENARVVEKVDGSCLIVSIFKGASIARTRGTFDAADHENTRAELPQLKQRYPKAFYNDDLASERFTYLYEWTTRANRIVVDYGEEADLRLIGVVEHEGYRLVSQDKLVDIAHNIGVKSPNRMNLGNIKDIHANLETLRNAEGYCVYYNDEQDIKKVKCSWYLERHRLKSNCNITSMLGFFVEYGFPEKQEFLDRLKSFIDFECMPEALELVDKLVETRRKAMIHEYSMLAFLKSMPANQSRKLTAQAIIKNYQDTGLEQYLFNLLDRGYLQSLQIKKLMLSLI